MKLSWGSMGSMMAPLAEKKRPFVSLTFEGLDAWNAAQAGRDATGGAQRVSLEKMFRLTAHTSHSSNFATHLAV